MTLLKRASEEGNENAIAYLEGPNNEDKTNEKLSDKLYMYDFVQEPAVPEHQEEKIHICKPTVQTSNHSPVEIPNSISLPSFSEVFKHHLEEFPILIQDSVAGLEEFQADAIRDAVLAKQESTWDSLSGSVQSLVSCESDGGVVFSLGGSEEDIHSNVNLWYDQGEDMMDIKLDHHFSSMVLQRHATMPNMQIVG